MIKCNMGSTEIRGCVTTILSEYSCITKCIFQALAETESKEEAQKTIKTSFDLAFMSDEELDKNREKLKANIQNNAFDKLLSELFGGGHNAD